MKTYQRARAFTDPIRLRILKALGASPTGLSRTQIADAVKIPTTGLGHHLNLLLSSRLIRRERKGQYSIYSLNREEYQALLERLYQIIVSGPPVEDDFVTQ